MGVLTEDLSRLRNEILALRSARQGLAQALERETQMRRADVSQTLANFCKSFAARARRMKADRLGSLSDLKRTVNDLRTEVRTDLGGIRQAWLGLSAPSLGVVEELASQPSEEAGAYPEEGPSETGGQPPLAVGGGKMPARKKRKH
jgi:hypothetical protein